MVRRDPLCRGCGRPLIAWRLRRYRFFHNAECKKYDRLVRRAAQRIAAHRASTFTSDVTRMGQQRR